MTRLYTLLLLALLQASAVGEQALRSGCAADDPLTATLSSQDAVEVLAARAGESEQICYKVMITRAGQVSGGYLLGESHPAVAAFVQQREKESAAAAEAQARLAREAAEAKSRPVAQPTEPNVPTHFDDFSGVGPNGDQIRLSSLDGRAYVVTFWSPGDAVQMHRLTDLLPIYNQLHKRGLEAVGVSMNPDPSRIQDVLDDISLPWPQIADQRHLAVKYHVNPSAGKTFVLDAAHNVIASGNNIDIEKVVGHLLEKP